MKAQHAVADKELARQKKLLIKQATSLEDLEKADADAKSLASQVDAAEHEVTASKLEKDIRRSRRRSAAASAPPA